MSTRGAFGFRLDGVDRISYNHSNSYPSYLGVRMLEQAGELLAGDRDTLKAQVRGITLVKQGDTPDQTVQALLAGMADLDVSGQSTSDWYCLLRNQQGDLPCCLRTGYMIDSEGFLGDSLFCEWGYVLNLDEDCLEVYRGFQKAAHIQGRYASGKAESGYFPCALVQVIPFAAIVAGEPNLKQGLLALETKGD